MRTVVYKMRADKVASSEGAEEGELACHDGSGDDTSKLLRILTRLRRMSAFDA